MRDCLEKRLGIFSFANLGLAALLTFNGCSLDNRISEDVELVKLGGVPRGVAERIKATTWKVEYREKLDVRTIEFSYYFIPKQSMLIEGWGQHNGTGSATAVYVDEQGRLYLLTADHLWEDEPHLKPNISFSDNKLTIANSPTKRALFIVRYDEEGIKREELEILARAPERDLLLARTVEPMGRYFQTTVPIGFDVRLYSGMPILTCGHPGGANSMLTNGIVAGEFYVDSSSSVEENVNSFPHTAPIGQGCSGGGCFGYVMENGTMKLVLVGVTTKVVTEPPNFGIASRVSSIEDLLASGGLSKEVIIKTDKVINAKTK